MEKNYVAKPKTAPTEEVSQEDMIRRRLTVSRLFVATGDVQLGPTTVYLRVLSDIELSEVSKSAMIAYQYFRKALLDTESDDSKALIQWIRDSTRPELIQGLVNAKQIDWVRSATQLYQPHFTPDITDADAGLKERASVIELREKAFDEAQRLRMAYLIEQEELFREECKEVPLDDLIIDAMNARVDYLSRGKYEEILTDYTILLACYDDDTFTTKFFPSIDNVQKMHPKAKWKISQSYTELANIDPFA